MSQKRKDSKGRVLRSGEVQRADGKYMFRYNDVNGERRAIYSWKLVETDKVPVGKRCDSALRTLEQAVLRDIEDGIATNDAKRSTVDSAFDQFMQLRKDLKESTRCNYLCLYNAHIRGLFGKKSVADVKYSDVYKLYIGLSQNDGLKINTIQAINAIIWQVFEMAVRNSYIRKNPVSGVMVDVAKKLKEEPEQRHALTEEEQSRLIDYIYSNEKYRKYGVLFTTLLGTGMRIGEALGLRWEDVDFKNGFIRVDHSLSYKDSENGGYKYKISPPKTRAGIRSIPMFSDVEKALRSEKRRKKNIELPQFSIDNYTDFIFTNSAGKVYTPSFIFDVLQNIVVDYNMDETVISRRDNRDPVYLPRISAHILRHTFCTRLCETDTNLKVIQDVLGHKNIRTTMNIYSEATAQSKLHSFKAIDGRIKLC